MKLYFCIIVICLSLEIQAQVPVRDEPRHHPVLVNQYFRVLDVWIPPGDTTLFHIHATPSLFLYFTSTDVGSQLKDSGWISGRNIKGNVSFEEFTKIRVHRVSNIDKSIFHVTDIEILLAYKPNDARKPLPYALLLDNKRAFAYRITDIDTVKTVINQRGPILAALVEGEDVFVYDNGKKKQTEISAGKFVFLEADGSFNISAKEKGVVNLVLFELK
jgi:hypothetical protein